MEDDMTFYEMDGPQRASIIEQIAWTLCNGDSYMMHVSNVGRDVLEKYGINEDTLYTALNEIADEVKVLEK